MESRLRHKSSILWDFLFLPHFPFPPEDKEKIEQSCNFLPSPWPHFNPRNHLIWCKYSRIQAALNFLCTKATKIWKVKHAYQCASGYASVNEIAWNISYCSLGTHTWRGVSHWFQRMTGQELGLLQEHVEHPTGRLKEKWRSDTTLKYIHQTWEKANIGV